jgi:hypothetical protein
VKAWPEDRNFTGDDPQRGFTPAVILFIALFHPRLKMERAFYR